MMKHSLFDKVFLSFLLLMICGFGILILYSTKSTKNAIIRDREEILLNEAQLIADQTVKPYYNSASSDSVGLQLSFDYYSHVLDASIWLTDPNGVVLISSNAAGHPEAPNNVKLINQDIDTKESKGYQGDFYGFFDTDVMTISLCITTNNKPNGMLFVHSTMSQFSSIHNELIQAIYVPFLIMIIISFTLLGIVSRKIMRPLKKINTVAEEYSTGNFDVKMDIQSDNEIGQLASTLEYMASEISKLDEYRKDFISNISHDFRSPLTSIKGYVEAIKDGTIPYEKQAKYLDIIVHETNRLTKLTEGLLELNNVDSYGLWLVFKNFDIVKLTKGAIDTFEGKCAQKNVSLYFNNHCEHSIVTADKTKIQQVIYNLIDNAIKFTPEGKCINVTLTEKNEKIFVSVKDEGCGIPKEALKKIWVRFYKADTSRGKDKQGTGLGLAITKEIIKAHNETINVVSTENIGSEFTFSLTRAEDNTSNDTTELRS